MHRAKVRLVVASVLFVAWLCWLGYLSVVTANQTVLSRPQLLTADAHVIAELHAGDDESPSNKVTIKKVLWASKRAKDLAEGSEIKIVDLDFFKAEQGWKGSGEYILPLSKVNKGFIVTPTPSSPGYAPEAALNLQPDDVHRQTKVYLARSRIYPADERTLRRLKNLQSNFHQR
jgi:hypothetical protein